MASPASIDPLDELELNQTHQILMLEQIPFHQAGDVALLKIHPDFAYNRHNESIFDDDRLFPSLQNTQDVVKFDDTNPDLINNATLRALIVQLTSPEVVDYNLICDFFLTYRVFVKAEQVLRLLLTRLIWSLQYINSPVTVNNKIGKLVLLRTFVVLRHWIINYYSDDFAKDPQLSNIFITTMNRITNQSRLIGEKAIFETKIICDLKMHWLNVVGKLETDMDNMLHFELPPKKFPTSDPDRSNASYRRSAMLSLYDKRSLHKIIVEFSNKDENPQYSINNLLAHHTSSRTSLNFKLQAMQQNKSPAFSNYQFQQPKQSKQQKQTSKHNHMNLKDSSLELKKWQKDFNKEDKENQEDYKVNYVNYQNNLNINNSPTNVQSTPIHTIISNTETLNSPNTPAITSHTIPSIANTPIINSRLNSFDLIRNIDSVSSLSERLPNVAPRSASSSVHSPTSSSCRVDAVGFSTNGNVKLPTSKITHILPPSPVKKMDYVIKGERQSLGDALDSSPKRSSRNLPSLDHTADFGRKKSMKKFVDSWKKLQHRSQKEKSEDFYLYSDNFDEEKELPIGNRVDILSARIIDELEFLITFYLKGQREQNTLNNDAIDESNLSENKDDEGEDLNGAVNVMVNNRQSYLESNQNAVYNNDESTRDIQTHEHANEVKIRSTEEQEIDLAETNQIHSPTYHSVYKQEQSKTDSYEFGTSPKTVPQNYGTDVIVDDESLDGQDIHDLSDLNILKIDNLINVKNVRASQVVRNEKHEAQVYQDIIPADEDTEEDIIQHGDILPQGGSMDIHSEAPTDAYSLKDQIDDENQLSILPNAHGEDITERDHADYITQQDDTPEVFAVKESTPEPTPEPSCGTLPSPQVSSEGSQESFQNPASVSWNDLLEHSNDPPEIEGDLDEFDFEFGKGEAKSELFFDVSSELPAEPQYISFNQSTRSFETSVSTPSNITQYDADIADLGIALSPQVIPQSTPQVRQISFSEVAHRRISTRNSIVSAFRRDSMKSYISYDSAFSVSRSSIKMEENDQGLRKKTGFTNLRADVADDLQGTDGITSSMMSHSSLRKSIRMSTLRALTELPFHLNDERADILRSARLSDVADSSIFSVAMKSRVNLVKHASEHLSNTSLANSVAIPGISSYVLKELAAIPDESYQSSDPVEFAFLKLEGRERVMRRQNNFVPKPSPSNLQRKEIYNTPEQDILNDIINSNTQDVIDFTHDFTLESPLTPKQTTEPKAILENYVPSSELLTVQNVFKESSHISFVLSFDSNSLADHFTLIETDMLQEIDWKDLIELKWNKELTPVNSWLEIIVNENYYNNNKGVNLVIARFNLMVNWIISEILLTQSQYERICIISRFIHVAQNCFQLQNFSTLMQVILALTSEKVQKLRATWKNLPPGDILMLKNLEELSSPIKNFLNLRLCINKMLPSQGCVPFVGLYLSDLIFNAERPTFVKLRPQLNHTISTMIPVNATQSVPPLSPALVAPVIPSLNLNPTATVSSNSSTAPATSGSSITAVNASNTSIYNGHEADVSVTTINTHNEPEKLINFSKFRTSVHIVKSLSQCIEWSGHYKISPDPELLLKCLYIKSLDEDEMNFCLAGLEDV